MSDQLLKCEVCQSLIDEEDLFCANCGTETPQRIAASPSGGQPATADTSRVATCNFQCKGCGASMSYDAKAQNLRCPFCSSVDLVAQADATILAPQVVVPFQIGQAQAAAIMREWLGRGFFRPGNLAQQAAIVRMQPVYVPYWVFSCKTHTFWTADTSQTPAGARGDWYPLSGERDGEYANLLIGASGALTPAETGELCPFDLATGVPPDEVDLDNITVEQFSVPRKYARPQARASLEELESRACIAAVSGQVRNVHVNVRIEGMASYPVLLPTWIMAYRYGDRVFRFLVNGQSGKATGQAPISWAKVALIPVLALAMLLAVLLCSGVLKTVLSMSARPHFPPPAVGQMANLPSFSQVDNPSHGPSAGATAALYWPYE